MENILRIERQSRDQNLDIRSKRDSQNKTEKGGFFHTFGRGFVGRGGWIVGWGGEPALLSLAVGTCEPAQGLDTAWNAGAECWATVDPMVRV